MIVCPRCGKDNQDHYKFCLGCGAELPRSVSQAPRAYTAQTPPRGVPKLETPAAAPPAAEAPRPSAVSGERQMEFARTQARGTASAPPPESIAETAPAAPAYTPAAQPAAAPPAAAQPIKCPACGNPVPADFKFCGTCGQKMVGAPAVSAAPAAKPAVPARRGVLILINPDGSEGVSFSLHADSTTIGREAGAPFTGDLFLSPVHATLTFKADRLHIADEKSLNGVYVKLERHASTVLEDGSIFRIGQEILRYEAIQPSRQVDGVELMGSPNPGYLGLICTITGRTSIGEAYAIPPDGAHIGRERGDVIFPEDGYVSGLHCRIHKEGEKILLTDVGSSNGTFLRIRGEREVRNGELLLIGQQLFCARY